MLAESCNQLFPGRCRSLPGWEYRLFSPEVVGDLPKPHLLGPDTCQRSEKQVGADVEAGIRQSLQVREKGRPNPTGRPCSHYAKVDVRLSDPRTSAIQARE